jgi:hypothetical protein
MTRRREHQRSGIVLAAIALVIGAPDIARAGERAGEFAFGLDLVAGTTYRRINVENRVVEAGGGGIGLDVGGRLWAGPVVVGATALALPGIAGPTELVAVAGAGAKLELGPGLRLISLLEGGIHGFMHMGGSLLDEVEGGTAALPCWGARLMLVKRPAQARLAALAFGLFVLVDRGSAEVRPRVKGFLGSDYNPADRHRAGGKLIGLSLNVVLGS